MENREDNTPYDDVYRTLVNDCTELMIPVVNEVFHENYSGKEEIVPLHEIHMMNQQDGNTKEKITDSCFEIRSEIPKKYHIECQSTPDGSIVIRFFEYDSQIALDDGELESHRLTVTFPHSAVLYLRHNSKTPDVLTIVIKTPGGDISYGIPIVKVKNYQLEEIFEKKLIFLLPFYIFCYEGELQEYEEDSEKLELLKQEFRMIREKLDTLCLEGEITEYVKCTIVDMMKRVVNNITAKYRHVREEVRMVMGGKVLEYEAKTILRKGIAQGITQGITQGIGQGIDRGRVLKQIELIMKKMKKGYSVPKIADEIEESEEFVKKIYDLIKQTGLEATPEMILEKVLLLQKEQAEK